MNEYRLGDDLDDFCVRCKRVMNHSVVSVVNHEPAKVRCRICHSDHDYRHEQAPPPKVDPRKAALFQEVLKRVNPEAAAAQAVSEDPPEPEAPVAEAPEAEVPEAEVLAAAPPPVKPKARTKARK